MTLWRGLWTLGGGLIGGRKAVRREVLDNDGSLLAVSVGRPLTAAQRRLVDSVARAKNN